MEQGWIKLHRSIGQHWIFQDAEMLRVWISILLQASHKHHKLLFNAALISIPRGSFVVSKLQWAKQLNVSRQRLDRVLKILERDEMIRQEANNLRTLISVVNYEGYQSGSEADAATDLTTPLASTCTTVDTSTARRLDSATATDSQPVDTIKNEQNENKEQNAIEVRAHASGELEHHFLQLEKDSTWVANPQYAKVGRKPLKKYPDMFLTHEELADVFRQLVEAGIPADQFRLVFMRVAARLNTYKSQGKSVATISVYNWLIGWAKQDVVKELTASCNLERSKVYLQGAKV